MKKYEGAKHSFTCKQENLNAVDCEVTLDGKVLLCHDFKLYCEAGEETKLVVSIPLGSVDIFIRHALLENGEIQSNDLPFTFKQEFPVALECIAELDGIRMPGAGFTLMLKAGEPTRLVTSIPDEKTEEA